MKRWHRILALAVALVLINAATQLVTRANLAAGLYPADADAIGIPITTTLYLSLLFAPWLLLLAVFSRFKVVQARARSVLVVASLIGLYAPAVLFAGAGIAYWAMPQHYAIAAAYAVLLLVLIGLAADDLRALPALPAVATAPAAPMRPAFWYGFAVVLFLYALPVIHNLGCMELPFGSGFDLALLYLSLPAALIGIFGGRWLGPKVPSMHAGALVVGGALFVWLLAFGQGYIALANALLSPQRPVVYEAVIVEKLQSGFRGRDFILRVQPVAAPGTVMSMEVNENEYAQLSLGDRVAKPMVIGALGIPYIARCRWLRTSARRGM